MFFGIEKVMSLKGVINLATCLGKKTTIKARFEDFDHQAEDSSPI